jgi:hypothetical protein
MTESYLNPPDRTLVLCVDEKEHIQALNRSTSELEADLRCHLSVQNQVAKPFVWTQTADALLASIARLERTPDSGH